jgi:hypothetical protein
MWCDKDENSAKVIESNAMSSANSYVFGSNELITSFANNPNLDKVKNDYAIWGEKETVTGEKALIHMRYAIDIKPTRYKQIYVENDNEEIKKYNEKYKTKLTGQVTPREFTTAEYDWREIIY